MVPFHGLPTHIQHAAAAALRRRTEGGSMNFRTG
jgi:hypothetical protein